MNKIRKYIPLCILIAVYFVMSWQLFGQKPSPSVLAVILYAAVCLLTLSISALLVMDGIRLYKESRRVSKLIWNICYALLPILCTVLDTVQYLRYFELV